MFEPIEKNGKRWLPVFIAGEYPQATIDEAFLFQVALNYDVTFHEAPIWLGHPGYDDTGHKEPQALAWVEALMLVGSVLYACLKDETPEFKKLIAEKRFKVWSAELVEFLVNGSEHKPYLFAIGLTNRPAVHGIKPFTINADQKFTGHIFKGSEIENKYIFEITNSKNQKENKMKKLILELCKKYGLTFTESDDDSKIVTALEGKFTEVSGKVTELETKVKTFTQASGDNGAAKIAELQTKLDEQEKKLADQNAERITEFVDAAIASGKLVPAQKDSMVELGKANFTSLKNFVAAQGTNPLFTKQVNTGAAASPAAAVFNLNDAKYKHPTENRQVTFSDLAKDFKLQEKFTYDEIEALRIAEAAQS